MSVSTRLFGGISSTNYNWKEVTGVFRHSAGELVLGELLHDANFGLFEAMSAIEMMDPKMDAGMLCNQGVRKIQSFEHGIETGQVKVAGFEKEELCEIMDATLCCLVTWLEGHSTAQTLFTNVYLHNPYLIEDVALKAFSIGILRLIDLIRDIVNKAAAYEEEDFQPLTYGFKLAPDVTDVRAAGMLKEAEDELQRRIRNVRAKSNESGSGSEEDVKMEFDRVAAISARVKFLRHFILTLIALTKEKCTGVAEAQRHMALLRETLVGVVTTKPVSKSPSPSNDDDVNDKKPSDYPQVMGFEQLITQRLLPPTFPRYSKIKSWQETVTSLENLLDRLVRGTQALSLTNLHQLIDFFAQFSKTSPCVLSRSVLQLLVIPPSRRLFGTTAMSDALRDTLKTFIQAPIFNNKCPLATLPHVKEVLDSYMTRAGYSLVSLLLLSGHNRARQRDKWAMALEELGALQEESEKLDQFLQTQWIKHVPGKPFFASFTTWNVYHVICAMIAYVESGFELELYAVHEYPYILWYLGEFLYGWLLSTLNRADNYMTQNMAYCEELQKTSKSNKKNKKNKNKRTRPYGRELMYLQANQNLILGTYKAVLAFQLEERHPQPNYEFDSEEVRFNRRFSPFACIATPPAIPYVQYKEITSFDRTCPPTHLDLYNYAAKHFSQAKTMYEGLQTGEIPPAPGMPADLPELDHLLKIAKTNFVVMKLLLGGHKADVKARPEYDFSCHKIYPIIKV